MQKPVIEIVSITQDSNKDYRLAIKMKLFADGVDVKTTEPVLEVEKSGVVKGYVADKTVDDLIARTVSRIAAEFQAEVDRYQKEKEILAKVDTKAIADALDVSKVVI